MSNVLVSGRQQSADFSPLQCEPIQLLQSNVARLIFLRLSGLKSALLLALIVLCAPLLQLRALDLPSATGPEAGSELAAELRAMQPTEPVKWRGALKILRHGQPALSVPVLCEITPGTNNWTVMYLAAATAVSGAEKLTIVFSTNAPNQYIVARAPSPGAPLGEPKTLTGAEADIPFGGSDFWLSDLGFEFYHWPEQVRLPGQMRRSRPCYVLQSSNPHPEPGGYSRVVTWVEKESGQPLQAEAYATDGKLMKEFELGSVTKVNGGWQPKDLKMFNRKAGSRTYLDFDLKSQ